jgi:hypothetical protein
MEPTTRPWLGLKWGCDYTETDARNVRRTSLWLLGWSLAQVAASIALKTLAVEPPALALGLALLPSLLGLQAVRSYLRFLRETDELQRKIQLDAVALGFGAGMLFMFGYRLLERIGAPVLDTSDPVLVMMLVYAAGLWLGRRRYQ